jgi:Tol biopolymer transport system component/pimeloyl-ACP methyl ester carboxylesterase
VGGNVKAQLVKVMRVIVVLMFLVSLGGQGNSLQAAYGAPQVVSQIPPLEDLVLDDDRLDLDVGTRTTKSTGGPTQASGSFAQDPPRVGESVTGVFDIFNQSNHRVVVKRLIVGARGPGGSNLDWNTAPNADFPAVTDLVLEAGHSYRYKQSRTFSAAGNYFAEPVYQKDNGEWVGLIPYPRIYFRVQASTQPTPVPPPAAKIAVVLVHGFQGAGAIGDCDLGSLDGYFGARDGNIGLKQELESKGAYVEYARLNTSPCRSVRIEDNVQPLMDAIDRAKSFSGASKVVVVAHSMGGLVSRAYIEGSKYREDVSKLFTLGTPHTGVPISTEWYAIQFAPKLMNVWEFLGSQLAVEDFKPDVMARFNASHTKRDGVEYHIISGNAPEGAGLDWLFGAIANDGLVPLQSGLGSPGTMDRMTTQDTHISKWGADYFSKDSAGRQCVVDVLYNGRANCGGISTVSAVPPPPLEPPCQLDSWDKAMSYVALLGHPSVAVGVLMASCGNKAREFVDSVATAILKNIPLSGRAVHSPASIVVTDKSGRRAGVLNDGTVLHEIPDSYVMLVGDQKFVFYPSAEVSTLLRGTGTGVMTVDAVDAQAGKAQVAVFQNIPVSISTSASLESGSRQPVLAVDTNSDGRTDQTRTPDRFETISSGSGTAPSSSYSFSQTGFSVSGRLWEVWQSGRAFDDSLYINGFPITSLRPEVSATDGKTYQTQWFERSRFEQHPENQRPYDVLLGLLGASAGKGRQNEQPFKPIANPGGGTQWFPQTQHTLGDTSEGGRAVAAYWNKLGGLQQFGFPISQPFMEKNSGDGKTYLVQYFERQRFEYHPENKGTRYEVLLGRLGAEQLGGISSGTSGGVGKLAFISNFLADSQISVVTSNGTQQKQLTNTPKGNEWPAWSPDAKRLIFVSTRNGIAQLYVMNADGTGQTQVTTIPTGVGKGQWSPTGQQIAFTAAGSENRDDIYVVKPDGTNLVRLTSNPANDSFPVWSPNGNKIAFVSDRDHQSDIYIMNADGTSQMRLADTSPGDVNPVWSPDGNRIAFDSIVHPGTPQIYVVNADGTGLSRLTDDNGGSLPSWSPDGRQIAFTSDREGERKIYALNTQGAGVTRLTNNSGDVNPVWSPDGHWIAFQSVRDGNPEIYVMNADGSDQIRLTNNPGIDAAPVWAPK